MFIIFFTVNVRLSLSITYRYYRSLHRTIKNTNKRKVKLYFQYTYSRDTCEWKSFTRIKSLKRRLKSAIAVGRPAARPARTIRREIYTALKIRARSRRKGAPRPTGEKRCHGFLGSASFYSWG